MRRPPACLLAARAAALSVGACESPTADTQAADLGRVVALDSLRTADAAALPCCAVDTAGVHISIVAGTLTFRAYAHYTDTAETPAPWPVSAACVTAVPNGAVIHSDGLVTVGDSVSYLVIPCHVGTYTLALTERLEFRNGSSQMAVISLSSGTYSWKPDTLSLVNGAGEALMATMSVDTIIVAAPGHSYEFQAVASY